jgi:glutamine amidotransferase
MIAIVDYGLGNLNAFLSCYKNLNIDAQIASTPEILNDSSHIILPGVGSFDIAMSLLRASGLIESLIFNVVIKKKPILGVCVGMQMFADYSQENNSETKGLCWIEGSVRSMAQISLDKNLLVPHIGWNTVIPSFTSSLFDGIPKDSQFYFLHSYCFESSDFFTLAKSDYGIYFNSAIKKENIYGVQFHPEKSHECGSRLLENFSKI